MTTSSTAVDGVAARLATLRRRRAQHASPALADEVRDLVVVCASSRSGSSAFAELLRSHPQLVTTTAEINPHLTVPLLDAGGPTPDLVADPSPVVGEGPGRRVAATELSLDLGRAAAAVPPDALADQVAWRLTMQWPHVPVDPDEVRRWVGTVGSPGADRAAWFARLLALARRAHPQLATDAYDLATTDGGATSPDVPPPLVVEMAPFVVPRPWQPADVDDVRARPVVLATPRNAFRLPLLQRLFPAARLRVIHLVRNPAASVNGLIDGWSHRGFATVEVPEGLAIAGASDRRPAWRDWWCFDLPPGWREHRRAPLPEVCAFQWTAAQAETVAGSRRLGLERHVVRFEDVTGAPARRRRAMTDLAAWLGVDPMPLLGAGDPPVVMATAPPRPGRWRRRAATLAPVLRRPDVRGWADALGYGTDPDGWE